MIAPQTPLRPWFPGFPEVEDINIGSYAISFQSLFMEAGMPIWEITQLAPADDLGTMSENPTVLCVFNGGSWERVEPLTINATDTGFVATYPKTSASALACMIIKPNNESGWIDVRGTACAGTRWVFRTPEEA